MSASPFILVEDVAERYGTSRRWVLERTRLGAIPHRRLPGSRRCLFLERDLVLWENGATLRVREMAGGGRLIEPIEERP